jgi:hypothetical protein
VVLEYLMFGVIPTALSVAGIAITCAGVALVVWRNTAEDARRSATITLVKLVVVILLTVLAHTGFVGSRVVVSLYALNQHASPLTVGALLSLYALLPMLLAVSAGRLIDRVGVLQPMAWSGARSLAESRCLSSGRRWSALSSPHPLIGTHSWSITSHSTIRSAPWGPGRPRGELQLVRARIFARRLLRSAARRLRDRCAGHRAAFSAARAHSHAALCVLYLQRHGMPTAHASRRMSESGASPTFSASRGCAQRSSCERAARYRLGPVYLRHPDLRLAGRAVGFDDRHHHGLVRTGDLFRPPGHADARTPRLREWTVVTAALAISGCAYSLFRSLPT